MFYAIDYSYSTSGEEKSQWAANLATVKDAFGGNVFGVRFQYKEDAERLARRMRRECGVNVRVVATHTVGVSVL